MTKQMVAFASPTIFIGYRTKAFITLLLCISLIFLTVGCVSSNNGKVNNNTSSNAGTQDATKNDSSATNESGVPEYLNTGGTLSIVKEGYKKGFSASIKVDVNTGKIEDLWTYKFVKNAMNIDLKVDTFTSQNRSEYISLLFASNDLPDVIINGNLTPDELMMYGKLEGQIMDIAPYVNETYMPYLSNLYKENPSWKNAIRNM